jgi:hypothetical protein
MRYPKSTRVGEIQISSTMVPFFSTMRRECNHAWCRRTRAGHEAVRGSGRS